MAFAYHVSPTIESGKIGYIPGPAWAKVNTLEITVRGIGGHGARPHQGIDPIVLSARIILAMQTIISREISALEPAVLTVGAINGGNKHNIIPDEVHMMLTLRSYSNEVAEHMISAINRTCVGIAQSAGLPKSKYPIVIEVDESLPPGINNPELTERIAQILKDKMGDKVFQDEPSMGAEDFYRYGNTEHNIPVSMLRLGTVSKEKIEQYKKEGRQLPSLHSPLFAPDPELTIKTGIKAMSYLMIEMFNNNLKGN
jgi:hippurate hydrolase